VKLSSIVFCSVVVAGVLSVGERMSRAEAWRCEGATCSDVIINEVAATTFSIWPAVQSFSIADLPYSCLTKIDQCPRCLTGDSPAESGAGQVTEVSSGGTTQAVKTGTVPWSFAVSGPLRSFLFGTFTASADMLLTVQPSVGGSWAETAINYLFKEACDDEGKTAASCIHPLAIQASSTSAWSIFRRLLGIFGMRR
jgi:hypothetical protein